MRFKSVYRITADLGVSKMKYDSSQGVLHQWVRVTTQSLDAGFCNGVNQMPGVEANINIDDYYYDSVVVITTTANICYQFGEGQFG